MPRLEEQRVNSSRLNPGQTEKANINFFFQASLWCLERFYEGLNVLHKTF